jgi:hypothetical protein
MNHYENIGTGFRQGSPNIRASRPGQEYQPRRDQIESVMKDYSACFGRDMTAAEARAVCVKNYTAWRDQKRKWKWIQSDSGNYVQVEDK